MNGEVAFGGWLKQWRKEQGVRPDQLAERIGCSSIALLKIEAGERRPSRQMALLIAEFLGVAEDEYEAFVAFARVGQVGGDSTVAGEAVSEVPWRISRRYRTNLPFLLTYLIGRDKEVEEVRDLLTQTRVRLLTLTGPPGIGKTRMAMQIASQMLENFDGGVFVVELATIDDPDAIVAATARTLGLKEEGERGIEEILLGYLRDRRILLVLDNFEHLLDAAPTLAKLLESCPWLKVLTTSREALHLRGERRYPVPPLALPDIRVPFDLEKLRLEPAVALFVERAEEADPEFELGEDNAGDVAAVVHGLEGLPLAIELAAARSDQLTPKEMRDALGSRLELGRARGRALPPRQRTLRGAIEWSYGLLTDEEQEVFRCLGVFVGGFTAEAVAAVRGAGSVSAALDILLRLMDKSVVRRDGGGVAKREMRFGMLESIREFAKEHAQLEGYVKRREEAEKRHALYFVGLAEKAKSEMPGAAEVEWLERLESEHDNLRAALGWALERGDSDEVVREGQEEIGLRLCGALWRFWWVRGHVKEGRQWTALALGRGKTAKKDVRAGALNAAGNLAGSHGDYQAARAFQEEALGIRREIGDKKEIALALYNLGIVARPQGELEEAGRLFAESLAIRRELGDEAGVATTLNNLGIMARMRDDHRASGVFFREYLAFARKAGIKSGIAVALSNLGLVEQDLGEPGEAEALFEESLALRRELGDEVGIATIMMFLGTVARDRGEYEKAMKLLEESCEAHRAMDYRSGVAANLLYQGTVERARGRYKEARALMQESLELFTEIGEKGSIEEGHKQLEVLARAEGRQ